jgi:hypothetical protein
MKKYFTAVSEFSRVNLPQQITTVFKFAIVGQCYKTFYHGNLQPFNGNYQGNIASEHKMTVLPSKSGKLMQ